MDKREPKQNLSFKINTIASPSIIPRTVEARKSSRFKFKDNEVECQNLKSTNFEHRSKSQLLNKAVGGSTLFSDLEWKDIEVEEVIDRRISKRFGHPEDTKKTIILPFEEIAVPKTGLDFEQLTRNFGETDRLVKKRVKSLNKKECNSTNNSPQKPEKQNSPSTLHIFKSKGTTVSGVELKKNLIISPVRKRIDSVSIQSLNLAALSTIKAVNLSDLIRLKDMKTFDNYKVTGKLGFGSFSQIHLVENILLKEIRVMKVIKKEYLFSKNEVSLIRSLSHPNLMDTFEIFEDETEYFIMTEILRGRDLFEHINVRKVFPEEKATFIVYQILYVLNYLHSRNIIHRDIKPENILFTDTNKLELKVIDFGSAVKVEYVSKTCSEFHGTSYYIAPEVFAKKYNEKCDVWSVGVVFYTIICGYPPFNGKNSSEIYQNIMLKKVAFDREDWNEVQPEVLDLIKQMLTRNPDKRISAAEALKHPIFDIYKNLRSLKKKTVNKLQLFTDVPEVKKTLLLMTVTLIDVSYYKSQFKKEFVKIDKEQIGELNFKALSEELSKNEIAENEIVKA